MSPTCIAERELIYRRKGTSEEGRFAIRIFAPVRVEPGSVAFTVEKNVSGCSYEFDGFPQPIRDTAYGADSIQALQLALNIDSILKGLGRTYDFYFVDGEPYFESDPRTERK